MAIDHRIAFAEGYKEMKLFLPFFSAWFTTRPRDVKNATRYKFKIKRGGRYIAPVISAISQEGGRIKKSVVTAKEFQPPIQALRDDFNGEDLESVPFNQDEYSAANEEYIMSLMEMMLESMDEIDNQMVGHIEYQASQIFQTGAMTLYDEHGVSGFTIDFSPKPALFPTVSTSWSDTAATPDLDLSNLYQAIKTASGAIPKHLVFGKDALENYLARVGDKNFDTRRFEKGTFDPVSFSADAEYLGDWVVGTKRLACWAYDGRYEDPSNASTDTLSFIDKDNVVMLPEQGGANVDLRRIWLKVAHVTESDEKYRSMVPQKIETGDRRVYTKVWEEKGSDSVNIEVKARVMNIPASIDTFGCLDTSA